jgi:hypothetical protein
MKRGRCTESDRLRKTRNIINPTDYVKLENLAMGKNTVFWKVTHSLATIY